MENLFIIINPAAGTGKCMERFRNAERFLKERHVDYNLLISEYNGDIPSLVDEAIRRGAECVVLVGGDGTVREAVSSLVYRQVSFFIFPFGTGNDLAKALKIPIDPLQAVNLLLSGTASEIDAAKANNSYFLNAAGFGFDVEVVMQTERYKKRMKDKSAYVAGLIHALVHLRRRKVTIHTQEESAAFNAMIVSGGNGNYIGGGMLAHPQADITDGLLDIFIIHNVRQWKIPSILLKFLKGKHMDIPETRFIRTQKITIESETALPVQLDGEIIETTPVTFEVLPKALRIIK